MRIQLWLRLNLNIKSSAELSVGKGLSACRDQKWKKLTECWCLGERHKARGGTYLSPELSPGKIVLVWKSDPGMSDVSCDSSAESQAAPAQLLTDGERRHLQKERNPQEGDLCFLWDSKWRWGEKWSKEESRATGWAVAARGAPAAGPRLSVSVRAAHLNTVSLQTCPLILALRPSLVPFSSLDKLSPNCLFKVFLCSRGTENPTSRWISAACLCFLISWLNLMSHLKC